MRLKLRKVLRKEAFKLSENIEDIDICFDEFVNQSISGNFSFQQKSPSLIFRLTYVNYA